MCAESEERAWLAVEDGKAGCPVQDWDGPYSFRCGMGMKGECHKHGKFDAAPPDRPTPSPAPERCPTCGHPQPDGKNAHYADCADLPAILEAASAPVDPRIEAGRSELVTTVRSLKTTIGPYADYRFRNGWVAALDAVLNWVEGGFASAVTTGQGGSRNETTDEWLSVAARTFLGYIDLDEDDQSILEDALAAAFKWANPHLPKVHRHWRDGDYWFFLETGERRVPKKGEWALGAGSAFRATGEGELEYPILEGPIKLAGFRYDGEVAPAEDQTQAEANAGAPNPEAPVAAVSPVEGDGGRAAGEQVNEEGER